MLEYDFRLQKKVERGPSFGGNKRSRRNQRSKRNKSNKRTGTKRMKRQMFF
jgi:hypothetical protein